MGYILGLNSVYHESSVCLVGAGKLIAYAEEERFNRVKHGKFSSPANTDLLPYQSIDYCLRVGGISGPEITKVGFSFVPNKRLQNLGVDHYPLSGTGYGTETGEQLLQQKIRELPAKLAKYLNNPNLVWEWLDHHLCHAVSAVAVSPYAESAIIVIDGIAEFETTYLGYAKDGIIHPIKLISYPNSIGFLWEKISKFLGYTKYDAGKIMGLGAYGEDQQSYAQFRQFVTFGPGEFQIDNNILRIRSDEVGPLEEVFGLKLRTASDPILLAHANIAAGLQRITEEVILHLSEFLYLQIDPPTPNICLSGGVALNCQANARLAQHGPFKNVFIPPHCHDAGTSIGAALYLAPQDGYPVQIEQPFSPFWKTGWEDAEIESALQTASLRYERVAEIHQATAKLLAQGEIIAYCHGAAEIGPRALGNRSLLAAADGFMIKEILNFKVKRREFFRPLAPVILREYLTDYFELPFNFSPALYYMLMTLKVRPEKLNKITGVTHIDGTARVQVVDETINPNLFRLLTAYYEQTGIPVLLNTSFNHQEPIVHTPPDAIHTFNALSTLNYLVMNNYLVQKRG
ncbi:MAG: hypothetical protein BWK78_02200 [Thiotrichaceae bacterium IS1]|nr:MAG: hypothetical protein BWK78_02200 [Thiotrichaceae bacterium IS1]